MAKTKVQPKTRFITPKGLILGLAMGIALASLFSHPWIGFFGGAAIGLLLGSGWPRPAR